MEQKTIKEYIRALEHMTKFMQSLLEEELKTPLMPENDREKLSEITTLRILAKSEKWPLAVPEELICNDDEDQKLSRATDIINDYIKINISNKKILDFGCGEGHIPYIAANLFDVEKAVGYDPFPHLYETTWNKFENTPNLKFSANFKEIKENGPYDIILINDVIDHASENVLIKAKEVKSENGKILLRCHPWTSRHSTHLYKQLNKAYLQLVFTTDELFGMGLNETLTTKYIDPLANYNHLIEEAKLKIIEKNIITHPVELFFTHNPAILRRIKENWKDSNTVYASGVEFPRSILEIQFVDFVLN